MNWWLIFFRWSNQTNRFGWLILSWVKSLSWTVVGLSPFQSLLKAFWRLLWPVSTTPTWKQSSSAFHNSALNLLENTHWRTKRISVVETCRNSRPSSTMTGRVCPTKSVPGFVGRKISATSPNPIGNGWFYKDNTWSLGFLVRTRPISWKTSDVMVFPPWPFEVTHAARLTLISQFAFNVGLYYAIPGYYPAAEVVVPLRERALRLVGNHYLLSFGMYWMHRALHVVPWLWEKIHSYHHWAKHPLSRNTYDDHWLDNLGNAVIGHFCAQVLLPLDRNTFWFSHLIRILESLEKHSGVSCGLNLAHQLQRFLPFAQMPHHHDWHHEGHKGSNYTFTSIGGLWDCIFGTRKVGRAPEIMASQTTLMDRVQGKKAGRTRSFLDHPVLVLTPVFSVAALAFAKLHRDNYSLVKDQ